MMHSAILWQSAADAFSQVLGRHGLDPDAVNDVGAAWAAFCEFAQMGIEGLDPLPDSDLDGLIVQWGRYSWNDGRLSISFTRQLAVVNGGDPHAPDWQPEYWQVDLTMIFEDAPELMFLDGGQESDTGFRFEPVGPRRETALSELRECSQLSAAIAAHPVSSKLTFSRVD